MRNSKSCECDNNDKAKKLYQVLNEYQNAKGALIPVLHEVQGIYGYLPEEVLRIVSMELNVPMTDIYGVATFYSIFSLEPKGENVIRVCLGTACYVKESQKLLDRLTKELSIEVNQTTKDGLYTLEATRCLGACGLAPITMIGEKVYGGLIPNDLPKILKNQEKWVRSE